MSLCLTLPIQEPSFIEYRTLRLGPQFFHLLDGADIHPPYFSEAICPGVCVRQL